jgi:Domain of unknown function (DUF4440)
MMRGLAGKILLVACVGASLAFAAITAAAHPPAKLTLEQEKGVIEELMAFRKVLADAVASKDAKKLRTLYADSFRHTHASGAIDKKDAYIAAIVSGQAVIETAAVTELEIRIPGGWTGVVTGRSTLSPMADGKPGDVRWMSVFVRKGDSWQVAGCQVTAVGADKR